MSSSLVGQRSRALLSSQSVRLFSALAISSFLVTPAAGQTITWTNKSRDNLMWHEKNWDGTVPDGGAQSAKFATYAVDKTITVEKSSRAATSVSHLELDASNLTLCLTTGLTAVSTKVNAATTFSGTSAFTTDTLTFDQNRGSDLTLNLAGGVNVTKTITATGGATFNGSSSLTTNALKFGQTLTLNLAGGVRTETMEFNSGTTLRGTSDFWTTNLRLNANLNLGLTNGLRAETTEVTSSVVLSGNSSLTTGTLLLGHSLDVSLTGGVTAGTTRVATSSTLNGTSKVSTTNLSLGSNLNVSTSGGFTAETTRVTANSQLTGSGSFLTRNLHVESGANLENGKILSIFGTLSGGGTLKSVTVSGIHSPGGSMGSSFGLSGQSSVTQTIVGNLDYQKGSIFEWSLSGLEGKRGSAYDAVNASKLTGSGAIFRIVLAGVESSALTAGGNRSWSDIFRTSELNGANIGDWSSKFSHIEVANYTGPGRFSFVGNELQFSAVPEPSSALVGLLIAAGLCRRSRKPMFS